MIKAIETSYKNYRFRSRIEARWAVWLDAMGVEWKYEHEGYDLGKAGYYLPDFVVKIPVIGEDEELGWMCHISDKEFFLEIKPGNSFYFDRKHAALSKESGKDVVCAFGIPNEGKYGLYIYHEGEFIYPGICGENKNPESDFVFGTGIHDDLQIANDWGNYSLMLSKESHDEYLDFESDSLKYAYQQAMSARFEFGENGQ